MCGRDYHSKPLRQNIIQTVRSLHHNDLVRRHLYQVLKVQTRPQPSFKPQPNGLVQRSKDQNTLQVQDPLSSVSSLSTSILIN
jgi:hypothetical protein